MDSATMQLITIIIGVITSCGSIGAVYGLIRADLKNLHETTTRQDSELKSLRKEDAALHNRINEHVEKHHLKAAVNG